MKTTAFLILFGIVLINVELRVVVLVKGEREGDGMLPSTNLLRPSFPSFILPSFSLLSFNLSYLRAAGSRTKITLAQRILATKTQYMEVTRRQTVHPVCYTAYKAKVPCLPYEQSYFQDDDYEDVVQTHESIQLNRGKKVIQPTPAFEITPTPVSYLLKEGELSRNAKYLEIKFRRNGNIEKIESSKTEGSDFFFGLPTTSFVSYNRIFNKNCAHHKTGKVYRQKDYCYFICFKLFTGRQEHSYMSVLSKSY